MVMCKAIGNEKFLMRKESVGRYVYNQEIIGTFSKLGGLIALVATVRLCCAPLVFWRLNI
jgi:hypothetical protein